MPPNKINNEANDINLKELQSKFMNFILHENEDILFTINIENQLQANKRMKQYNKHYQGKLTKFLTSAYPILKIHLGEKRFNSVCQATISHYPSTYEPADTYKYKLVEYLSKNIEEQLGEEIIDLARFECIYSDLFRTHYPPSKSIKTIEQEELPKWVHYPIQINPSLKLISMKSNAAKVFFSLKTKTMTPALMIDKTPSYWSIWKFNNEIFFKKFTEFEKELYKLIACHEKPSQQGHSISALTTNIQNTHHSNNCLKQWLQIGIATPE